MAENASLKIWNALKPMIDREIERKTRDCCRAKTMVVSTAYNGTTKTVGVKEAFGAEVQLPVCSSIDTAALTAGAPVWVLVPYSSMSNAIVWMLGNG